jgi:hypothetical protein
MPVRRIGCRPSSESDGLVPRARLSRRRSGASSAADYEPDQREEALLDLA